jgi:hypothetical protein
MEHDEFVQDFLRQAQDAETWAERTQEPELQGRWRKFLRNIKSWPKAASRFWNGAASDCNHP